MTEKLPDDFHCGYCSQRKKACYGSLCSIVSGHWITCKDRVLTEQSYSDEMRWKEEISFWKTKLRLLKDWEIIYDTEAEYTGQCSCNSKIKKGIIYPYSNTGEETPKDYFLHEMVHFAIRAVIEEGISSEERQKREEALVQDFCNLWKMVKISGHAFHCHKCGTGFDDERALENNLCKVCREGRTRRRIGRGFTVYEQDEMQYLVWPYGPEPNL